MTHLDEAYIGNGKASVIIRSPFPRYLFKGILHFVSDSFSKMQNTKKSLFVCLFHVKDISLQHKGSLKRD